ncbi:MAG: response regulator [Candidatus Sumerlaeaceae bacterium]|nr:response regulator [Candidatus Sumerlaeaceae bacterium]
MRRAKILIADDVREIRDFLRFCLQDDYDIILARNGEEAWELFNAEKPDIVLSDCVMPRMTGLELLERIRNMSFRPETPVVIITAATSSSDIADGLWGKISGSDAFISKPFVPKQVQETVAKCLGRAPNAPAAPPGKLD